MPPKDRFSTRYDPLHVPRNHAVALARTRARTCRRRSSWLLDMAPLVLDHRRIAARLEGEGVAGGEGTEARRHRGSAGLRTLLVLLCASAPPVQPSGRQYGSAADGVVLEGGQGLVGVGQREQL